MSVILLAIAKWVWEFLQYSFTIPVLVGSVFIVATTGIVVFVVETFRGYLGIMQPLIDFLRGASTVVSGFLNSVESSSWFAFFANLLALDTLSTCLSWFIGLFVAVLSLITVGMVFASITAVVPFFILKATRTIVSISSAGRAKP